MKQRHIQNFLMISTAFFAISAPVGVRASSQSVGASSVQQVAQTRVQSVRAGAEKRRESEQDNDDKAL